MDAADLGLWAAVVYALLHALDLTLDESTPLIGRLVEINRRIAAFDAD